MIPWIEIPTDGRDIRGAEIRSSLQRLQRGNLQLVMVTIIGEIDVVNPDPEHRRELEGSHKP